MKQYFVYILTNKNNTVFYTGVTSDLIDRISQHRNKVVKGFTKRYNIDKLVYYEIIEDAYEAISREKQIKAGSRSKKLNLINNFNSRWRDLSNDL